MPAAAVVGVAVAVVVDSVVVVVVAPALGPVKCGV